MKMPFSAVLPLLLAISCGRLTGPAAPHGRAEKGPLYFCIDAAGTRAVSETGADTIISEGFAINVYDGTNNELLFSDSALYDENSGMFRSCGYHYHNGEGGMDICAVCPASIPVDRTPDGNPALLCEGIWTPPGGGGESYPDIVAARTFHALYDREVIPLKFHHILGRLILSVKAIDPNVSYILRSLSIDVPEKGLCRFSDFAWTADGRLTLPLTAQPIPLEQGGSLTVGEWVFIPGTVKFEAEWECVLEGITVAVYRKSTQTDIQAGKITGITLLLSNSGTEELTFALSVTPWQENGVEVKF